MKKLLLSLVFVLVTASSAASQVLTYRITSYRIGSFHAPGWGWSSVTYGKTQPIEEGYVVVDTDERTVTFTAPEEQKYRFRGVVTPQWEIQPHGWQTAYLHIEDMKFGNRCILDLIQNDKGQLAGVCVIDGVNVYRYDLKTE